MKLIKTNRKILVAISISFIVFSSALFYFNNSFVPFAPLTFDKSYKSVVINDNLSKNIQKVLLYYNVDFYVKDYNIYIKRKIASDKNLMINYTNKAQDENWLKDHKLR